VAPSHLGLGRSALAGSAPAWTRDEYTDLDTLEVRAEEIEKLWEKLLSEPIDVERVIVVAPTDCCDHPSRSANRERARARNAARKIITSAFPDSTHPSNPFVIMRSISG
jgi:hypothetical protein